MKGGKLLPAYCMELRSLKGEGMEGACTIGMLACKQHSPVASWTPQLCQPIQLQHAWQPATHGSAAKSAQTAGRGSRQRSRPRTCKEFDTMKPQVNAAQRSAT